MINRLEPISNPIGVSLLMLCFLAFDMSVAVSHTRPQSINTDPGHKEYVEVGGIRFSSPNYFAAKQDKSTRESVYIQQERFDLGLVVSVPGKSIDELYVKNLATGLTKYLYPKEITSYTWKRLEGYEKVSRFEIAGGMIQGFNGQQRVFFQYRVVGVKGKEVLVGYIFGMGRGEEARILFERGLGGDSMLGWYAQAHIIASITGEKYEDLDKGGGVAAPPPPRV